ncbi:MAG: hypothetical protein QOH61_2149, partial [Chloroflexota bacterium]|nr:hypothetical protein [Chloroflexota bacterium]
MMEHRRPFRDLMPALFSLRRATLRFGLFATIAGVVVALPLDAARGATSTLRRYPYLTDVSGANATVNWATDTSATSGSLRWGAAAADG